MNDHLDFPLTDSEKTALQYILEHGVTHGYQIYQKSELSDKTTYVALKRLTEKGLLEKKPAAEKRRPGQPMQKYYLTLVGLSVGLTISDESWKKIEVVISRWEHLLPFVFKRWKLFKDQGLTEEVKKALRQRMEEYMMRWRLGHRWVDEGEAFIEDFVRHMDSLRAIEVKMKWLKILHLDKDLRKRLEDYHKTQLTISQAIVEEQRSKVKIIVMLQETEPDWEKIEKMANQRAALMVNRG